MSLRVYIDRLTVDRGVIAPGGEATFRARLEAALRERIGGGGTRAPGAMDTVGLVADAVGRRIAAEQGRG